MQGADWRLKGYLACGGSFSGRTARRELVTDSPVAKLWKRLIESLSALPQDALHVGARHFASLALRKSSTSDDDEDILWVESGDHTDAILAPKSPDLKRLLFALEAVGAQSTLSSGCRDLLNLNIIEIVQRTWKWLDSDAGGNALPLRVLILKCLANLAAFHSDAAATIVHSGWLDTVNKFGQRSSALEVTLLSAKLLDNVAQWADVEGRRARPRYEDGVYLLSGGADAHFDVVFVHGLRGGMFRSWRLRDAPKAAAATARSRCWPRDLLAADLPRPARLIGVDYASYVSDWTRRRSGDGAIAARADALHRELVAAGLGHRPVVWVAHSMGGLLVKQLLVQSAERAAASRAVAPLKRLVAAVRGGDASTAAHEQTVGCLFLSTPHFGSPVAARSVDSRYGRLLLPSIEVKQVREGADSLQRLNDSFCQLAADHGYTVVSVGETRPTTLRRAKISYTATLVPLRSAYPRYGAFYAADDNHLNTCKPQDSQSQLYSIVLSFFRDAMLSSAVHTE